METIVSMALVILYLLLRDYIINKTAFDKIVVLFFANSRVRNTCAREIQFVGGEGAVGPSSFIVVDKI